MSHCLHGQIDILSTNLGVDGVEVTLGDDGLLSPLVVKNRLDMYLKVCNVTVLFVSKKELQ